MGKFVKDCFYKYKGGSTKSLLVENVIYKCTHSDEYGATLSLIVSKNGKCDSYIIPVIHKDYKYFNKSGVQEENWIPKNNKTFAGINNLNNKISPTYSTPNSGNPYVAYPPNFDKNIITFGKPAVSYPPTAKFDDSEIATNPNHYKQGGIEPIDYIEANNLGFCEANVIKYITRHKLKNGKEDVLKAIKYCEFILKYQYND